MKRIDIRPHEKLDVWQEAINRGSLSELETQMIIASRLNYLSNNFVNEILELTDRIGSMLTALIKSVSRKWEENRKS